MQNGFDFPQGIPAWEDFYLLQIEVEKKLSLTLTTKKMFQVDKQKYPLQTSALSSATKMRGIYVSPENTDSKFSLGNSVQGLTIFFLYYRPKECTNRNERDQENSTMDDR